MKSFFVVCTLVVVAVGILASETTPSTDGADYHSRTATEAIETAETQKRNKAYTDACFSFKYAESAWGKSTHKNASQMRENMIQEQKFVCPAGLRPN